MVLFDLVIYTGCPIFVLGPGRQFVCQSCFFSIVSSTLQRWHLRDILESEKHIIQSMSQYGVK